MSRTCGAARAVQSPRRMTRPTSFALLVLSACASASVPLPDASTVPRTATGTYALASQIDLATIPAPATAMLGSLASAIDDPDDPSRYLVDRIVATLPDGDVKSVAEDLAPIVAAYLQSQIDSVAPRFVPGIRAIADGLARASRQFGTIETLRVGVDGTAARAITGITLDIAGNGTPLVFGAFGLADLVATAQLTLDPSGNLAVAHHQVTLPYGALLRLELDHAVIPSVDLQATNLAVALHDLVDCTRLGELIADKLSVGTPELYAAACEAGLDAAASDLYAQLAAADAALALDMTGAARGVDTTGDGTLDVIDDGEWTGTANDAPLGDASFTGTRQ